MFCLMRVLHHDMSREELLRMNVAVFTTYLDESGIDRAGACAVAGFLGGIPAQSNLGRKWKKILAHYHVSGPFHSHEFYAPPNKIKLSTTNPYRGWSNKRRRRFISDLLQVIEDQNIVLMGCGVDSIAFHNRTEDERRAMTGGVFNAMRKTWAHQGKPSAPYFLALRATIEFAGARTVLAEESNPLAMFVMSEQNEYERGAMQMYRNLLDMNPPLPYRKVLGEPMTFATHKRLPQLQAADLAAYHIYQYSCERRVDRYAEPGRVLKRLLKCKASPEDVRFVTAESLERICSKFKAKKDEADKQGHLRLTRLRVKASHEPGECRIIGRVSEEGTFHLESQSI
jgi:hypothetical protein